MTPVDDLHAHHACRVAVWYQMGKMGQEPPSLQLTASKTRLCKACAALV